jgi:signal peptidase I
MNKESHNLVKEVGFSLLAEGKTVRIRADGYSMYPLIRPGNIIYIEPFAEDEAPLPGTVIAWKRETGFVVHRLIRIIREEERTNFITRGDSCINEDKPVTADQLAGLVVRTENSRGKRIRSGEELIRKPNYLYNRLLVWFVIRFRKLMSLAGKR